MDEVLQKKLYDDFPKIFIEKDLPKQETCMCWGFCCDDGWFNLIYKLCSHLQWDTDKNKYPQVIALQVKEKFGTLRFYYSLDYSDHVLETDEKTSIRRCAENDGAIQFAEALSASICESCGEFDETVELKIRGGWYKTLCSNCADRLDYQSLKKEKA